MMGGFVGKSNQKQAVRRGALRNKVGGAVNKGAGFAGSSAGKDKQRGGAMKDCLKLRGIKLV